MQVFDKNRLPGGGIAAERRSAEPRAALPHACFFAIAVALAVATATPLSVLVARS